MATEISSYLVVGLGNPGSRYEQSRHNVGFQAVDLLAVRYHARVDRKRFQGCYGRIRMGDRPVLLVKPQTYMNRSGQCVRAFSDYYRVRPAAILVIHDDLDLDFGRIKVVARGGAGGHNGVRSIISHLGTREFARVRFGIGRPGDDQEGMPVERFVLARFSAHEQEVVRQRLETVCEAVELFVTRGAAYCMNRINGLR